MKKDPNLIYYVFIFFAIYPAFFGVIGFTVYWTESMLPLWFLLLTPTVRDIKEEEEQS